MKKKYQIFISSTYTDLQLERQAAVEAILKAGHIPAGMELFSAGNESQLEIIKRWINESDIYMLLLGGRYGSIETKSKLSYTEVEYRYALELEKPVFAIIMDETSLNKKVKTNGKNVLELDNPDKYKLFKEFTESKICSYFKNVIEIKLYVMESLLDIQSRYDLAGWVKSTEVPDVSSLLNEIGELREQNKKLTDTIKQKSNSKQLERITNKFGDFTFEELKKLLKNEKVTIQATISNSKKDEKSDVFSIFLNHASDFAIGISSNPYSATESSKFLIKYIATHLMTYDLVEKIKSTGSNYDKFHTSKIGHRFIAYFKLLNFKK